jgi:nitric oxide reductase large subunit
MEYISLKEASKITGYHPDYLSYLIREKKIEGKKIGRNWFTTEKAIIDYLSTKNFLSIKEFLSSKINQRTLFILILLFLISIGCFYLYSLKTSEDIKAKNEIREIRITNYTLEEEEVKGPVK